MYKFTKKEKKKINSIAKKFYEDIYSLYCDTDLDMLTIDLPGMYYFDIIGDNKEVIKTSAELYIDDTGIVLRSTHVYKDNLYTISCFESGNFCRSVTDNCFNNDAVIIDNAAEIRSRFLEKIKDAKRKSDIIKKIDRRNLNKEAIIKIDMPDSNAKQKIVVTNEDGRTVGTIDCGDRVIKIITDGSICLVNEKELVHKEKVKTNK